MRIGIVNPFYDLAAESAIEVTGRYRHVEALSSALARRGHDVVAVLAFHEDRTERRNGVEFRYARTPQRPIARLSGGTLGVDLLTRANLKRLMETLIDARPDAVHINGLTLLQPLLAVGAWCAKTGRPLTVSYHGGGPRRAPWLWPVQRIALARCRAVFFPTPANALPWIDTGLLRTDQVIPCMEVSSTFAPAGRTSARARTGMTGRPVFAWNGGLHRRKDPLTALKGFSLIRRRWPEARLYMIYLSSEMEHEVRRAIAADPHLAASVEMRGLIPPAAVEDFFNSADFLIQPSLSEIGCYSVLEAMSCGVIPVATDIPLFDMVTAHGEHGILFPVGDHRTMADKVLAYDLANLDSQSRGVRRFFEQALSYDAIARSYEAALASGTADGETRLSPQTSR